MKVIIAGGRNYILNGDDFSKLDELEIDEVVSGGQRGADKGGEEYAKSKGLHVTIFPAQWDRYDRAAGPIRNRLMAEYADAVVLFPGGSGTSSMRREAHRAGIQIFDFAKSNMNNKAPSMMECGDTISRKLPTAASGFYLEHNDHRTIYGNIQDALADLEPYWVSKEECDKAVKTDSVWTAHWYPDNPVGFQKVAASTLGALLVALENFNPAPAPKPVDDIPW